jgi:hypothetical protein
MNKQLILGLVGALWGGGIVLNELTRDHSTTSGAYESGRNMAMIFGAAIFVAGVRALYIWTRRRAEL